MVKRITREIDEAKAPYFGVDTEEVVLLRHLAETLRHWRDEVDGFSSEDVRSALDALDNHNKKRRGNKKN